VNDTIQERTTNRPRAHPWPRGPRGREVSSNEATGLQESAHGAPRARRVAIVCETVPPTGQQIDAFQDGLHILASWIIRRHMRECLKLSKALPESP